MATQGDRDYYHELHDDPLIQVKPIAWAEGQAFGQGVTWAGGQAFTFQSCPGAKKPQAFNQTGRFGTRRNHFRVSMRSISFLNGWLTGSVTQAFSHWVRAGERVPRLRFKADSKHWGRTFALAPDPRGRCGEIAAGLIFFRLADGR